MHSACNKTYCIKNRMNFIRLYIARTSKIYGNIVNKFGNVQVQKKGTIKET